MTGSQKRKGDRAERGAAELLAALTGEDVRRLLGAGRHDDHGDLDLPDWAVQVADWVDVARALRVKPLDAAEQALRSGLPYGAAMLRLRGGEYRIVLTPETFARIYRRLEVDKWLTAHSSEPDARSSGGASGERYSPGTGTPAPTAEP